MTKTLKQIANDCGMNPMQGLRLEHAVEGKGGTHDPTIMEVVGLLFRRIEKLEVHVSTYADQLATYEREVTEAIRPEGLDEN